MDSTPSNDASLARRRFEFITQQFNSYSGTRKRINDTSFFISCPVHSEKTPSGRVYLDPNSRSPGFFHCYGCGCKLRYDELAPKIGLKPFKWAMPTLQEAPKIFREVEEVKKDVLEFFDLPHDKSWRAIPTNLLIDLGASICKNAWSDERFVWLPVRIKTALKGYIRARLRKIPDKPSYLNKKGRWSENYGLFPYDYAVKVMLEEGLRTLVLVEGPRDALRLLNHKIPAIAILGTQSWSETKSRMLALSGAKSIVLMMDGDDAGIKACRLVTPLMEKMLEVSTFSLHGKDSPYHQFRNEDEPSKAAKAKGVELWDPGNCPMKKIAELRKLLKL